jgi:hypothetical protein
MTHAVTCEDLGGRVPHLAPVMREHAARGEHERHLMDAVVEALEDARRSHLLVPRTLGGLQVDPPTLYWVCPHLGSVFTRYRGGGDLRAGPVRTKLAGSVLGSSQRG